MTDFEGVSSTREGDVDLRGEYWQSYMTLNERHARELEEIKNRHFRETVSLHLDFPDDPDAIAYLEGVGSSREGAEAIEEIRIQKEEENPKL